MLVYGLVLEMRGRGEGSVMWDGEGEGKEGGGASDTSTARPVMSHLYKLSTQAKPAVIGAEVITSD